MSDQSKYVLEPSPLRPSGVSLQRDRIGRAVARGLGIAAVVGGIVTGLHAPSLVKALGALLTGVSFCSWVFYVARTADGPAANDSEDQ